MIFTNYAKRFYETTVTILIYYYNKVLFTYSRMLFINKMAIVIVTLISAIYFVPLKYPDNFVVKNSYIVNLSNYMNFIQEKYINDEPLPAEKLKHLRPKHPVIILPGITSTTLETWQDSKKEFRSNIWGKFDMVIQLLTDVNAWFDAISLDKDTGLDKSGCKVRPGNGLSSSDYILPLYWVWQKMLNNFGIIGYDHLNLHVSTYDWRLSCENLEVRDKYFSKLKLEIEMYYKLNNQKVVLLTHSLGSIITLYFLSWVETVEKGFVERYIHTFINIAAPFLGVSKSISGLLSGQSRTTASFLEGILFDFLVHSDMRKELFRSWGSIKTLLPKGGAKVWGAEFTVNLDGVDFYVDELVHILQTEKDIEKGLREKVLEKKNKRPIVEKEECEVDMKIHSLKLKTNFITECLLGLKTKIADYRVERDALLQSITDNVNSIVELYKNKKSGTKVLNNNDNDWIDPLKCKLPNSPSLKIYSCYGIGKPTERGYYYTFTKEGKLKIKTTVKGTNVVNGVKLCDGDGTVPIFSLGYMGFRGWKNSSRNPAGIKTFIREYRHEATYMKGIRGGPKTSEHVDILGNYDLTNDILHICCGVDENIEDQIISNIAELSDQIDANE